MSIDYDFALAAPDRFKQLGIKILEMRYRRGNIDGIELAPKETPMEVLLA